MGAKVVKQSLWMYRIACDGRLRQLCVKSRVSRDCRRCNMVGMRVIGVRNEKHLASDSTEYCSECMTMRKCVGQFSVSQSQIDPLTAKHGVCRACFLHPSVVVSAWRWLAIGQIDDRHAMSLIHESRNGSAHAEFRVIWMWRDNDDRKGLVRTRAHGA